MLDRGPPAAAETRGASVGTRFGPASGAGPRPWSLAYRPGTAHRQPLEAGNWGISVEETYGYDPDRARELLAAAGYPDAFPDSVIPIVSMPFPGNPEFPPMAELIQVYFEEIGLQTEIRGMDSASVGALGRGRQAYLLNPIRNAPIRPSEVGLRNTFTPEGSPFHGYEDDTLLGLIDQLRATLDPDERHVLIQEAFTYAFEQYTDIPIAAIRAEVVVNPEIVADWTFPGATSVGTSHWHLIKAAE